jgi:hypothetical protein
MGKSGGIYINYPQKIAYVRLSVSMVSNIFSIILFIQFTLYPQWGNRGISDITPRRSRFTKKT